MKAGKRPLAAKEMAQVCATGPEHTEPACRAQAGCRQYLTPPPSAGAVRTCSLTSEALTPLMGAQLPLRGHRYNTSRIGRLCHTPEYKPSGDSQENLPGFLSKLYHPGQIQSLTHLFSFVFPAFKLGKKERERDREGGKTRGKERGRREGGQKDIMTLENTDSRFQCPWMKCHWNMTHSFPYCLVLICFCSSRPERARDHMTRKA